MSRHSGKRRRSPQIVRRVPPGAPPGVVTVDPAAAPTVVRVAAYGPEEHREGRIDHPDEIRKYLGKYPVTWVDVDGLADARTIERLGEIFGLHSLALEDVVNVHQRAKVDQFGEHLFIVARMPAFPEQLVTEQISLFLGRNFVLSFQERPGDSLEPIRERIRRDRGRIREQGPDYLAYALLDAVVDSYFPILERYGERIDALEEQLLVQGGQHVISRIHDIKSELLLMRRAIWPHREALNALARDPHDLIAPETRIFLRDCYDHTVQIIDLVETYRKLGADLRDFYLSSVSNRMNEIMKVLTIISTIFIPLTFIAGVYGMNFDPDASPWNMPELNWRFGYPFSLVLMAASAAAMLIYFRRTGWLGATPPAPAEPAEPLSPAGHYPRDDRPAAATSP